jgi:hypothetical protein
LDVTYLVSLRTIQSALFSPFEERGLAPKKQSDDPLSHECPICFLNYEAVNEATCCKQMICTDCYLLVKKGSKGELTCPFCGISPLSVKYTPGDSTSTPQSQAKAAVSTPGTAASSQGDPGSAAKKTPSPAPVHVPLSSISDRKELEKEIQGLRKKYVEDQAPPVPRSYPHRSPNSRGRNTYSHGRLGLGLEELGLGDLADADTAELRMRFREAMAAQRAQARARLGGSGGGGGGGGSSGAGPDLSTAALETAYLQGRSGMDRLEQMMLNEVIRTHLGAFEYVGFTLPLSL